MKRTIGACMILAVLGATALTGCGGASEDPAAAAGGTPATAGAGDGAGDDSGDFVARLDALCRHLAVGFAVDLRTALSDTDHLAEAVQTTDPDALAPTFSAAEAGFGRAVDLVDSVRTEFADLDAPTDAAPTITAVTAALDTLGQMLTDVQQAAAERDLAGFAAAIGRLNNLEEAQLDGAAQALADIGATACRPTG